MNRHALLIGINQYPGFSPASQLDGCVNDIHVMADLLETRFGFPESSIRCLQDGEATRQAILAKMDALTSVDEDDVVVFHFSGHGSQKTDDNDDEPDGLDETIVPCDSGRGDKLPNRDITDDEIYDWLLKLNDRTTNVSLIFDSCHSGTITRDLLFGAKVRKVEIDERSKEILQEEAGGDAAEKVEKKGPKLESPSGWLPGSARYALFAACRDAELAHEHTLRRGAPAPHGAWSFFLAEQLAKAEPGMTCREIFERAATLLTACYPAQHPQLEGHLDREIFGLQTFAPARFVRVKQRQREHVVLAAGAAHGSVPGSRWAVYRQGTRTFSDLGSKDDQQQRLGTVEVALVGAVTAFCDVESEIEPDAVQENDRAVEIERQDRDMQLVVELQGVSSDRRELEDFASQAADSNLLRLAEEGEQGDARVCLLEPRSAVDEEHDPVPQLGALAQRTWAAIDAGGHLRMPALRVDDAFETDRLITNLESLARYQQVLRLDNPDPESALKNQVDLIFKTRTAGGEWARAETSPGGEIVFTSGQRVALKIVNRFTKSIYIHLLDFGLSGSIDQLYPAPGNKEPIGPGRSVAIGSRQGESLFFELPEGFPFERVRSKGRIGGTEHLKLFVTLEPTDFSTLQQPAMKQRDLQSLRSLEKLFRLALSGQGQREARLIRAEGNEDWTTVTRSFFVQAAE